MDIFVSGSLAYDRIMNFPDKFSNHLLPEKLHILNVCFLVNDLQERFGGTAGNIAYSLSLLEEEPVVLAAAGNDFERYKQWMNKHNISMRGVREVKDLPTASAYITTDESDNQITAFNPGAMNYSTNETFKEPGTKQVLAIVSPGNLEDMQAYPKIYKGLGIPYILDPGQNIPAFSGDQLKNMLDGAYALIVNDYELSLVMEATGLKKEKLLGHCEMIATTLGEEGCLIHKHNEEIRVPAVKVEQPKDPTGAGDAFRSGFLKGIKQSKSLKDCAQMGSTCASFCVEKKGTQEHRFTLDEFWSRYNQNYL